MSKIFHSLPNLDITPMKDDCVAELPYTLTQNFVDEVWYEMTQADYTFVKLNHREHGDPLPVKGLKNPLDIDHNTIDQRIIVRQSNSGFNNSCFFKAFGNIKDPRLENIPFVKTLKNIIGDPLDSFNSIIFLKFNGEQGFMPHKDGGGGCRIYIPIRPKGLDYSRLEFYYDNQIYYLYNDTDIPKAYLFSQEVPHALFNQGYPDRYNLQIGTDLSYKEAIKLFQ